MKTIHLWLKRVTELGLTLVMGASMSANAGWFGFGGTSWKEEVLLHDGSKIIVERTVERGGRHEIGQRPPIGDQRMGFTMPDTNQQIIWKDGYSEDVGGGNFNLMAFDIVQGSAYLVATPAGCLSYNKWGRPNPPYVIFKYDGKEWQRVSLQELPAEINRPNMLNSSPDDVAKKSAQDGVVPAAVIRRENDEFRQPEYRAILREPLPEKRVKQMCEELIRYKCGWGAPGEFNRKYFENACK